MPESRQPDIIDAIVRMCRDRGQTAPVSAESYQSFIEMDDDASTSLIKLLARNDRNLCKRGTDQMPSPDLEADTISRIESQLWCVAHGVIRFDAHGRSKFFAPEGPEPDAAQTDAIAQRIARMLPQVLPAIRDMLSSEMN